MLQGEVQTEAIPDKQRQLFVLLFVDAPVRADGLPAPGQARIEVIYSSDKVPASGVPIHFQTPGGCPGSVFQIVAWAPGAKVQPSGGGRFEASAFVPATGDFLVATDRLAFEACGQFGSQQVSLTFTPQPFVKS